MLVHERPLHLAAGLFLLYLGVKTAFARRSGTEAPPPAVAASRAFAGSVLLTLTNPPTIIMFAAIFASLAPAGGFRLGDAAATVGGVFAGSLLWWCSMVAMVCAVRHAIGPRARRWIDRVAGAALALFGLAEIKRAV